MFIKNLFPILVVLTCFCFSFYAFSYSSKTEGMSGANGECLHCNPNMNVVNVEINELTGFDNPALLELARLTGNTFDKKDLEAGATR